MDEYDRRARYGDVNSGQFNDKSRQVVQNLLDNWNSPEVKNLRGHWTTSDDREVTNSTLSMESLAQAGGVGQDQLFGRFVDAKMAPRKEAPTVRSEMVLDVTPPKHFSKAVSDPRLEDKMARDAEAERISSAADLSGWGRNNLKRYDITGDDAVNRGETDLGIRTTRDKDSFHKLHQIQDEFDTLSRNGKVVNQKTWTEMFATRNRHSRQTKQDGKLATRRTSPPLTRETSWRQCSKPEAAIPTTHFSMCSTVSRVISMVKSVRRI
jgi:hypothetical protein